MLAPGRPKGLRVRTDCTTEEQFIAVFHRTCDEASIFAPTEKMLPEGAECAFSLELADGRPMLRGLGVVMASWANASNRFARPGVQIALIQLTSASEPMMSRLLSTRAAADASPRRMTSTQRRIIAAAEMAGWPEEESVVRDVRKSITQEMKAHGVDSAAPVPIEEKSNNTTRYEGPLRAPAMPARRLAPDAEARSSSAPHKLPGTATTEAAPLPPAPPKKASLPPPLPRRADAGAAKDSRAPDLASRETQRAAEAAAKNPAPDRSLGEAPVATTAERDLSLRETPLPPGTETQSAETAVASAVAAVPAPAAKTPRAFVAAVWATIVGWFAAAGERFPRAADRVHAAGRWIVQLAQRAKPFTSRIASAAKPRLITLRDGMRPTATKVLAALRAAGSRIAADARRVARSIAPAARRFSAWTAPARERLAQPRWRNARIAAIFAAGIFVGLITSSLFRSDTPPPRSTPAIVPIAMNTTQCTASPELPALAAAEIDDAAPAKTVPMKKHVATAKPTAPKTAAKPAAAIKQPTAQPTATKPTAAPTKPAAKPIATSTAKPAAPKAVAATPAAAKPPMAAAKQAPATPSTTTAPRKRKCTTLDCI